MERYVAGVDEAGRGPVLGPMVMCACACTPDALAKLVELGVKDSKLLTPERRKELSPQIRKLCTVEVAIVPPNEIDAAVLSRKDNLNYLEARTSAQLLQKLVKKLGKDLDEAYIDCPSTNTKRYTEQLHGLLKRDLKLVCEHKADARYPVVAAASIIAKVTRDREMLQVSKLAGADVGSGYITDPKTHAWLQEHFDSDYGFLRRSWASVKVLKEGKAQRSLFQYDIGHAKELQGFDKLQDFGFTYLEPENQYELVRMRGPEYVPVTIIRFSTGTLTVQGSEAAKKKANALLQSVGLL